MDNVIIDSNDYYHIYCTLQNRERTLQRATAAFQTSSKTINAIKDAAVAANIASQQVRTQNVTDSMITSY